MPFSKKFFRLRREGRKRRKSGYYWIYWALDPTAASGMSIRVGHYNEHTDTWSLPGAIRFYKDADFLRIDERPISQFPWSFLSKVLLILAALCIGISVGFWIINIIHDIKHLTK